MNQAVPVIMYHSVGRPDKNWSKFFLTCPFTVFEKRMDLLARRGFNTVSLQELYDYMSSGKPLPPKPLVLTFDDGYLDNWVYAYPILKKYGFKGTIYVNASFVDPTIEYRPNLDDVWSERASLGELEDRGFLSWREMKEMVANGVMDIQSHAHTHTWYFNSASIVDFRHPGDRYIWIDWNEYPETKYDYRKAIYPPRYGSPVYSYGPSLSTKRYFPDLALEKTLVDYVDENGGEAFFNRKDWRAELLMLAEDYQKTHRLSDWVETEEEYLRRVGHELSYPKKKIEQELDKEARFLCWPGGAYNEITLRIASEIGYLSSTYSSRDKGGRNKFSEDATRVKRIPDLHASNITQP